jgi:hypothetical protein
VSEGIAVAIGGCAGRCHVSAIHVCTVAS